MQQENEPELTGVTGAAGSGKNAKAANASAASNVGTGAGPSALPSFLRTSSASPQGETSQTKIPRFTPEAVLQDDFQPSFHASKVQSSASQRNAAGTTRAPQSGASTQQRAQRAAASQGQRTERTQQTSQRQAQYMQTAQRKARYAQESQYVAREAQRRSRSAAENPAQPTAAQRAQQSRQYARQYTVQRAENNLSGRAQQYGMPQTQEGTPVLTSSNPYLSAYKPARKKREGAGIGLGIGALAAALLVVALGCGWFFFLRSVSLTVNDQQVSVRVNTSIESLLSSHNNFDAKPGRLLSVNGNVLNETGGTTCSVTLDGSEVQASSFGDEHLSGGEKLTVSDGVDTTEEYEETIEDVQPGIQMEAGGAIQYVSQWGKPGKKTTWTGKTSGETCDKGITEEPQDMIVASINPKPDTGDGKKYMALTFDDGPSSYTQQILDILAEKGCKATFFNLGSNANNNPSLSKAVVDGGHELASHTMQHQNLPSLERDALRSEITTAFDALSNDTGVTVQMIRAPYGAFTSTEWARSGDLISCNVLWNIDTLDWKRPGAEAIKNEVLNKARNGYIALMHDGGGDRSQDVEALPGIIDGLRAQGYELVTVSELMRLDGRVPEEVINGTVSLPEGCVMPAV